MKPNDNKLSRDSSDDSLSPPGNHEHNAHEENPDHPVRQMIRRVRATERYVGPFDLKKKVDLDSTTWDRELDTPGSTDHSELQSFASSLENYAQLVDTEGAQTDLPNQIGRFQIQGILGAGGFGWVLLADDPQLNRPVALKVPRLDTLISQTGRARFLREARAAALLSHPNLVSVYEAGQIGPVLYIAFEWIDGQSLSQWLPENRATLDSASIASMMSALAHAVQHAHQRGIVHRDLKPSNILIKTADHDTSDLAGRAKIADFGLAFLAEGDGELTRSGTLMGTPKYLAPEQIRSSGAQTDPTIDVYGLGAVMYEMLTGQVPFSGPTLAAIVRAVELDPPIHPRKLNATISKDLEAICLKCLEKNPSQRYRTAAALADDLDRFVEGVPVRARSPNSIERIFRWVNRNRLVSFAFAFAVLSLSIGLIVAATQVIRANANLAERKLQFQRAERHRDRGKIVVDKLLNDFSESLEPIPQMQPLRRNLLQIALDHERASMADEGDDPESQLRVADSLDRISDLLYRLGEFDEALDACEDLQKVVSRLQPNDSEQRSRGFLFRAQALILKSQILIDQGAPADVENELEEFLTQTASDRTPDVMRMRAKALSVRGLSLRNRGNTKAAEDSFLDAITIWKALYQVDLTAVDGNDLIRTMSMIGGLRYSAGNYAEAIKIWEEVAGFETGQDTSLHQNIVLGNRSAILANLAKAHFFNRDYDEALKYYQECNDQYRELCLQFPLHFDHASGRLSALFGRSGALQHVGQYKEAIDSYEEAVAWAETSIQRFGETPGLLTEAGRGSGNFGNVLQFMGNEQRAIDVWNRGLIYGRKNLKQHPAHSSNLRDLIFALNNLTSFHLQKNQLDKASELMDEAMPMAQQALDQCSENQTVITSVCNLRANRAWLFCLQQHHDECLEEIGRIVELQPDHANTLVVAARTTARCQLSVKVNLHELFGGDDDEEIVSRYADRALELLRSARKLGFRDFASLRHQPEFSGLVVSPGFAELDNGDK